MPKNNVVPLLDFKKSRVESNKKPLSKIHQNNLSDITAEELSALNKPVIFFVCDPLISHFCSSYAVDYSMIERIASDGISTFGDKQTIFNNVANSTIKYLENKSGNSDSLLEKVMLGNLINLVANDSLEPITADTTYNYCGVIVYRYQGGNDSTFVSLRPMSIKPQKELLKTEMLIKKICRTIFNDYITNPSPFIGVNVMERINSFANAMDVEIGLWPYR
ncbi:MAG: hypothetical protein ACJAS1_000817 [Oleiphilaceae bacterium]|jgi:hypothetical protein